MNELDKSLQASPIEKLKAETRRYLDHLNGQKPLNDEFKNIKARIITLACDLLNEPRQAGIGPSVPQLHQALLFLEMVPSWPADDWQGLKYHALQHARDLRELEATLKLPTPPGDALVTTKKPYLWVYPNPAGVSRQLMTLPDAWEFVSGWPSYGSDGEGIELTLTFLTDAEVAALPEV